MENGESMEDRPASKQGKRSKFPVVVKSIFLSISLFVILYVAVKIFLSSTFAVRLVSDYFSGILHQRVMISGLKLSGASVSLLGIRVDNPGGFPSGTLLDVRSLRVAPDITQILSGKRSLALLRVEGMKVDLQKNSVGEWNYSGILRILTAKKRKPSPEFFIRRLIIRDAALEIGNYSFEKLALTAKDFSAKGLKSSRIVIAGADAGGDAFRIFVEGRFGKDPDLRLSFEAPRISTETFKFLFKGKSFLDLEKGLANLYLTAGYHSGVVVAKGRLSFDGLGLVMKGRKSAVRGGLDFAGRYVAANDEADVEQIVLVINDKIKLDASGMVRNVRADKEFVADLSSNKVPLSDLQIFLPPGIERNMALNGTVECKDLHLTGNREKGITYGKGKILLRNGKASRGAQLLFQGLSSDTLITRVSGGWNLGGTLSVNARAGKVLLKNVHARFNSRFSDKFVPLSFEVPVLKAGLMGVLVHGSLTYSPTKREPYGGKLFVKNARLSALNSLLRRKNIDLVSGTADLTVWGRGQGLSSFAGKMVARIRALKGQISGKDYALKSVKITSDFRRSRAGMIANGMVSADEGLYSGGNFSAMFDWSLAGDKLKLTDGTFSLNRAGIRFAGISGRLPVRETARGRVRYPLVFAISGMDLSVGEIYFKDISGRVSAFFSPGSGSGMLTGNASLALSSVNYRKKHIGSIKVLTEISGGRAVAEIDGAAIGGAISSVVKLDPFSPAKGISFKGKLGEAQAVQLSGFLPDLFKLKFSSGKFNADFDGHWSGKGGLQLGLDGSGAGLSVAVKSGKTVISGVGVEFNTDVAGSEILVREAAVSKGKAVSVRVAGKVSDATSAVRKGELSFDFSSAPVNTLLDTFANILPRSLQEANGAGGVGAYGSLRFAGGKVLLAGNAKFENAGLDIPSQKLSLSGMSGSIPFSIYLAGQGVSKPSTDAFFTRGNYSSLLKSLSLESKGGRLLKIDNVKFGAVETGDISMKIKAEKGRMEVTSVKSSLYNGTVLGKGWFVYDQGTYYGLDLLINNMSLRRFCLSYPAVKGYISGLLDGIISIYGGKGGISALIGYIDLWTHEGKGEEMLVSKEFLQKLAGRNLRGFFFRDDRPYDKGEISAYLMDGYVTFEKLDITHTNFLGMKDLNVSVAPVQNMIALDHLLQTIREAAARGKPSAGEAPQVAPVQPDINWLQ
jgi:hypothetical protein